MTTPPYVFYALFCALFHNKYGLPGFEAETAIKPINSFFAGDLSSVTSRLLELAAAHESKDSSQFPAYVQAMNGGSNRKTQRLIRIRTISKALRDELDRQQ